MKKLLCVIVVLLLCGISFAQASRYESVAQSTKVVNAVTVVAPLPNASILVCAFPGPCTSANKVTLYTDNTGTTPSDNPLSADANGNFGFWATAGNYQYVVTQKGVTFGPYKLTVAADPSNMVDKSSNQTIGGNKTFSGNTTFNGTVTAPGGINANVTGTLSGVVIGSVTGNVTGNLTGDIASSGASAAKNLNGFRYANTVDGIQAAITDLGGPGVVYLPNSNTNIASTITVPAGVSLIGRGSRTSITWTGAAGQPIIKVQDASNTVIRDLRIYGNTTNRPSAAVEYNQGGGNTLYGNFMQNVYIGDDFTSTLQFDAGLVFSGTVNGHFGSFRDVRIFNATTCIDIQNSNASDIHFDTLFVTKCGIGIKTKAKIVGTNWLFTTNSTTDIQLETGGEVSVNHFVGESGSRMAVFNGGGTGLYIRRGSWQASSFLNADGRFIDTGINNDVVVDLQDFRLFHVSESVAPTIRVNRQGIDGGLTNASLTLRQTRGIYPPNIDLGTVVAQLDSRNFIYEPSQESGQDLQPRQRISPNYAKSTKRGFQAWRNDDAGELNVWGGPLNVTKLPVPATVAVTPTGGAATTYNYKVTALSYDGETDLSSVATTAAGPTTLDATHYNTITWQTSLGAYGYNVYRDTGGGTYQKLKTVTWASDFHDGKGSSKSPQYRDDGTDTPSGAAPTSNTTGNASVEGSLVVGGSLTFGSPITFPSGQTYGPTATGSTLNSGSTPQVQNGSWGYTEIKGNTGAGDACLKLPRVGSGSNNLSTSWVCNSYNGNFSGMITLWSSKVGSGVLNPNDAIKSATFWVDNTNTYSHLDLTGGLRVNQAANTKPTCASGIRGMFWYTAGAAGVKDAVEVCAKDAADAYAWRTIY